MASVTAITEVVPPALGDRVYQIFPFLKDGETEISGHEMVERAKQLDANAGKEDREWFLAHEGEIPYRVKPLFKLFFPAAMWDELQIPCLGELDDCDWGATWFHPVLSRGGDDRLVRRVK